MGSPTFLYIWCLSFEEKWTPKSPPIIKPKINKP